MGIKNENEKIKKGKRPDAYQKIGLCRLRFGVRQSSGALNFHQPSTTLTAAGNTRVC